MNKCFRLNENGSCQRIGIKVLYNFLKLNCCRKIIRASFKQKWIMSKNKIEIYDLQVQQVIFSLIVTYISHLILLNYVFDIWDPPQQKEGLGQKIRKFILMIILFQLI